MQAAERRIYRVPPEGAGGNPAMRRPYSRNISSAATMLEAEAQRSRMTTGALGFSQV